MSIYVLSNHIYVKLKYMWGSNVLPKHCRLSNKNSSFTYKELHFELLFRKSKEY